MKYLINCPEHRVLELSEKEYLDQLADENPYWQCPVCGGKAVWHEYNNTPQHPELVARLVKPGDQIASTITPAHAHLLHMVLGIAGEVGELVDAVKKHIIYERPMDRANVIEELGDLEFYLEGLRQGLSLSRDMILLHNHRKLSARYSSGTYSNAEAHLRADKNGEQL